ncbi:MAG TPA: NADH-quinone oxidoreductase subunit N [Pyrinomonadaceae bacterium]|jgi:NADH-quinone oxidoreductase subunit N|nr:NADH-quinone oxidoreductase subunit N [Pyrinomonadaceae bacterium]
MFLFQVANPDVNLALIAPELIIGVAGVIVMLVDAFTDRRQRNVTASLSIVALLAAGAASIWLWMRWPATSAFNGMIVLDELRLSFTVVFLIVAILTILIATIWIDVEDLPAGEFHSLLLFATSGMMLMASAGDLVIVFLGLEILSIATYVLAGFRRTDTRSNESSLKYFILGSFASAFLLYGIALIYGATATGPDQPGTTNIALIAARANQSLYPPLLFAGIAMLLVGFGFKIATAPFHVWTPDVYEGAPTPVTAFMAAGPKAAGFAAFMRVFLFGFPMATAATTAGYAHATWVGALAIMAALTMSIGNVVAIVQNNVKRMLAYSSIAHAGYALVGFVAAGAATDVTQRGAALTAVAFYLLTYAVMNMGAFAIVTVIARKGDQRNKVDDYNGIGFSSPVLAFSLSIFLLSLLGMPLTAGFMGKILVFSAAINQGYVWLVVIGVLNTAVSAYYYLRLIVVMFFREPSGAWEAPRIPAAVAVALILTILGVFYLGLFPGRIISIFSPKPPVSISVR